ncbi:MAG TPA: hypothetical protein VKF36_23915 [Syntrophorhabdales bacterium]|nr:hypothetical protein [Syntrophorhabdales bacterium]
MSKRKKYKNLQLDPRSTALVPIDCGAGHLRGRRMLERQMEEPAYNYTVAVTHSDLITFE